MTADIWMSGREARVIIRENGQIIDTDDSWNNIASAQMAVSSGYPAAQLTTHRDDASRKRLDREWMEIKTGCS